MIKQPFNINEEWAQAPLSRAEAFILLSKMQRLVTLHSRFRMAMDQKDADGARYYSDEITVLAADLDGLLNALVVMPEVAT